jgi:hypothetical protein
MHTLAKIFALSLAAATLVAPAFAGPMGGGGGGWGGGGGGAILPGGGGGVGPGPGGHVSGGFAPRSQAAPTGSFAQQRLSGGWVGGKPSGGDLWRRHHPWPGGPIFVPSGAYYSYGDDYDYDDTDVSRCWVYRKAYNSRHQFVGWTHVNVCAG